MKNKSPILAIVIPCYNEQEMLPISIPMLNEIIHKMVSDGLVSDGSYILCVDDGSKDGTWSVLRNLKSENDRLKAIKLAHNRGHQIALFAGLMEVKDSCDISISIDADLQDDVNAMYDMIRAYKEDNVDIVYGVRNNRDTDTFFKRTTAHAFYKLQQFMGQQIIYDHADYRLMSAQALDILSEYNERNLFLRGIIPQIGLNTSMVKYTRKERVAGETKYPLSKMVALSIDGITSFSNKPIRLIFIVGFILLIVAFIMLGYILCSYFLGRTISGWTSIMVSIWFLGSLSLIGMGIVGEYIGKIYMEVKQRPRYNVEDMLV